MIRADHVGCLFAYHDRRNIRIAGNQPRHDRTICDPQAVDAAQTQARIDYCIVVATHPAGAGRMKNSGAVLSREGEKACVASAIRTGQDFRGDVIGQRRRCGEPPGERDSCDGAAPVGLSCEIVGVDLRGRERIGRS